MRREIREISEIRERETREKIDVPVATRAVCSTRSRVVPEDAAFTVPLAALERALISPAAAIVHDGEVASVPGLAGGEYGGLHGSVEGDWWFGVSTISTARASRVSSSRVSSSSRVGRSRIGRSRIAAPASRCWLSRFVVVRRSCSQGYLQKKK